jgi:hypothetical protein
MQQQQQVDQVEQEGPLSVHKLEVFLLIDKGIWN